MLKRFDVNIISDPTCNEPIYDIVAADFKFYDKDGFELNQAEQKYYKVSNHPIDYPILNHKCWQEPLFELENKDNKLILDHCMVLHRCNYSGHAAYQLQKIKKDIPEAEWLLKTPQKWGFDFALDAVSPDGEIYEVLHIEYDNYDYTKFINAMISFEYTVRHTDWFNAATQILSHKDEWKHLSGFAQNDWKSNFLIGWKRSEYTEKSLTF
jgi:hypothetical protein